MCQVVGERAKQLKSDNDASNTFSWRYHLDKNQVQSWLNETEWNYNMELNKPLFNGVISMLNDLDLVGEEESKKAFQILFENES
jgi:hypothetical protein